MAGALLVPGSLAIISGSFDEEKRGRAIGTWSGFTAITAGVGPVLGGWLIEQVSWRAVFFINTPLAVIVLLVAFLHVPESRDDDANTALDWRGVALATLGLGMLVYGLIESSNFGFGHPLVLTTLFGGALLLAVFLLVEARSPNPRLPLSLFRSRNFTTDAFSVHGFGRRHVLLSAQPDSGPRVLGDGRGRRLASFHSHYVFTLTLVRRIENK